MKTVYEAANATEAYMLIDLLKQQGIPAHLLGEHLQGAIGELPAAGLVRIVADEEDFEAARAVITEWEGTHVEPTPEQVPPSRPRARISRWIALGAVAGAALMAAAFHSPAGTEGIDHNRDGVLDETWTYSPAGRLLKAEVDRNLDGKVDYVTHYDMRGVAEAAEADDDFNGTFETRHRLRNGNVEASEADSDGDGIPDIRWRYAHGVLATMEYLAPSTGRALRVEHYRLGRLVHADVDTDRDGTLDTRLAYDAALEIASRQAIAGAGASK